jgi:[ribosomal protein S18]-alanine N-acetyltransferase
MSFQIRRVEKADLAAVYGLELATFGDQGAASGHCYPDFFFRQCLDCCPSGFWVAHNARGELVGYLLAMMGENKGSLWILSLAVAESARGQGIGRQLTLSCLGALPGDILEVLLTVAPDNPAISLYASLGFEPAGFEADYFGQGEPRTLMALRRPGTGALGEQSPQCMEATS